MLRSFYGSICSLVIFELFPISVAIFKQYQVTKYQMDKKLPLILS